jgi:hypothetical protein
MARGRCGGWFGGFFLVAGSAALLGATAGLPPTAAAGAAAPPASVVLVHGVRGLVADVYVDGKLALATFQPVRSTDPISLPAGPHMVDVRQAGAAATSTPILHAQVSLVGGIRQSAVVHLDAAGKPAITLFRDDVSQVPAGATRVVVRHVAAVGAVNVLIDGQAVAKSLVSDHEIEQQTKAGSHQLAVTDPGTSANLSPPQQINFAEGSANFMYLIGSQKDGTLGWAAVAVPGLQTAPLRVQTGDGSLAGDGSTSRLDVAIPAGLAAVLVGLLAWRWPRGRLRRA